MFNPFSLLQITKKKRLLLMLCHGDNLHLIGLHILNTWLQDEAWQL